MCQIVRTVLAFDLGFVSDCFALVVNAAPMIYKYVINLVQIHKFFVYL